jgi:hypothetical protein
LGVERGGGPHVPQLQAVHDDAEFLHLDVTAVLNLLGHLVALPDDLLDGQTADDGSRGRI